MDKRFAFQMTLAIALAANQPVFAQDITQLKRENAELKAQLEALKAQGCATSSPHDGDRAREVLSASVESIRVGRRASHPGQPDGHVTITLALRNVGTRPIAMNYLSGTFRLVDEFGRDYRATLKKASGLPTATAREADPTAVIAAGASRLITFNAFRVPSASDGVPQRFDVNATFIEIEDAGQGRIKKVRDHAIGLTDVPASGS